MKVAFTTLEGEVPAAVRIASQLRRHRGWFFLDDGADNLTRCRIEWSLAGDEDESRCVSSVAISRERLGCFGRRDDFLWHGDRTHWGRGGKPPSCAPALVSRHSVRARVHAYGCSWSCARPPAALGLQERGNIHAESPAELFLEPVPSLDQGSLQSAPILQPFLGAGL